MSNTTFVNQSTVIVADWLNDVNRTVYNVLGDGINVPTTPIEAFNRIKQPASVTDSGVVELATTAEAQAADPTKVLTGSTLKDSQIQQKTSVTLSGQTSVDFSSIPAWVKKITVGCSGVSLSGTANLILQLGDVGGIEASGYQGSVALLADATNPLVAVGAASHHLLSVGNQASFAYSGTVSITKLGTGNEWTFSHVFGIAGSARTMLGGGSKALSDVLTTVRIATSNGVDVLDAGIVGTATDSVKG